MRPSCRRQARPGPRRRVTIRRAGGIQLARTDRRGPAPEGARPHGKPRQGSALRRPLRAAQQWLVHQVGPLARGNRADGRGTRPSPPWMTGADAAARLLRRYYRDYSRRSALAIVRRWAPPNAGAPPWRAAPQWRRLPSRPPSRRGAGPNAARPLPRPPRPGGAPRVAAARPARGGASGPALVAARPHGRPSGRAQRCAASPRRVRWAISPRASCRTPTGPPRASPIPAALLGNGRVPSPDRMVAESALLPAIAAGLPLLDLRLPAPLCAGDTVRINNYAARISGSVGLKPGRRSPSLRAGRIALPNLAPSCSPCRRWNSAPCARGRTSSPGDRSARAGTIGLGAAISGLGRTHHPCDRAFAAPPHARLSLPEPDGPWPPPANTFASRAGSALRAFAEASQDLLVQPTLRLGVTGLARSGKTVFTTALIHHLVETHALPAFAAAQEGRLRRARLVPQPDDDVPRFPLRGAFRDPDRGPRVAALHRPDQPVPPGDSPTNAPQGWRSGPATLMLDVVDYPANGSSTSP